jgi:hypothetical protein
VLGGRDVALACEELTLRARADLDAGRPREAALQLRIALESALSELTPWADREAISRRIGELREERGTVAAAANTAINGGLDEDNRRRGPARARAARGRAAGPHDRRPGLTPGLPPLPDRRSNPRLSVGLTTVNAGGTPRESGRCKHEFQSNTGGMTMGQADGQGTKDKGRGGPRMRQVIVAAGIIGAVAAPMGVAATGQALREGVRNGTATQETEIISRNGATTGLKGGYSTRQSNLSSSGGGAIYGCRSDAGSSAANPPQNPCLRANNLRRGKAFEFNATNGPSSARSRPAAPAATRSSRSPRTPRASRPA